MVNILNLQLQTLQIKYYIKWKYARYPEHFIYNPLWVSVTCLVLKPLNPVDVFSGSALCNVNLCRGEKVDLTPLNISVGKKMNGVIQ